MLLPWLARLSLCLLLSGCSGLPAATSVPSATAPLRVEVLPTIVEMTMQVLRAEGVAHSEEAGRKPAAGPTASPDGAAPDAMQTPEIDPANIPAPTGAETGEPPLTATVQPAETTALDPEPTEETLLAPTTHSTATPTLGLPVDLTKAGEKTVVIKNPGPASRVVSPLRVQADVRTEPGGQVHVEVLGEDGRVLVREIKQIYGTYRAGFARLQMDLEFEISAPAEEGRIKISVLDAAGRMTALNSVPVVLLSMGFADILIPVMQTSPILLAEPIPGAQQGTLLVTGAARLLKGQPMMARLIDAEGAELGSRLIGYYQGEGDVYLPFAVEVPYRVEEPVEALLVVWAGGDSLQDIIYLTSVKVKLGN